MVVIALVVVFLYPLRRSRAMWGVLGGIFLAQAPTMLAFSAPYNDYLATAGIAVLLTMWARRLRPLQPRLVGCTPGRSGGGYLAGMWAGAWMLHSAATAERVVRANAWTPGQPSIRRARACFSSISPFSPLKSAPALRNAADRPDLEVYPLTFAPDLFFPNTRVAVEQEDDHTLLVRSRGDAFFAGAFGDQVQLGWFGAGRGDLKVDRSPCGPRPLPCRFASKWSRRTARASTPCASCSTVASTTPNYRFFLGSSRGLRGATVVSPGRDL